MIDMNEQGVSVRLEVDEDCRRVRSGLRRMETTGSAKESVRPLLYTLKEHRPETNMHALLRVAVAPVGATSAALCVRDRGP